MIPKTIAEVVRTGGEFTAFVLEPYQTTVEKVISSPNENQCTSLLKCFYPTAVIVSKDDFVEEVQKRMSSMYRPANDNT